MKAAVQLAVGFAFAFLAGWFFSEWRHADERARLREQIALTAELANASAVMSQKSLNYALYYQETLNTCLERMGIAPAKENVHVAAQADRTTR